MLEKIGLPARPSLRGNTWVVDASHCQGCSSQFTFINRKHHCRRCGGLFCGGCTSQRMVLRGQGDSPVRICDPCKKLEEAARFEMRYGRKNRTGRGNSRLTEKDDNEILSQILSSDEKVSLSVRQESNSDVKSSVQRASSSASCSNSQEVSKPDGGSQSCRNVSVDEPRHELQTEIGTSSPEELHQRALDEKKKYKILKGEGKPKEALKAFKRGKELERQANALEIYLRKNRKKVSPSRNTANPMNKDGSKESNRNTTPVSFVDKEKDDLTAELRELGWSDMDICEDDKKVANITLEGEFSNILGEVAERTGKSKSSHLIDKSEVVAYKKRALTLKREGKLAEAKEELKKAKILEKQLEEQELLAEAEDSDDELSVLIHSMKNETQDDLSSGFDQGPAFNFDHMLDINDNNMLDANFEVTDDDMEDPEITAALKSLGWTEDSSNRDDTMLQSISADRKVLSNEILSLKKEALNQKRAGNVSEAMSYLKRAKLLERDLENLDSQETNKVARSTDVIHKDLEIPDKSSVKTQMDSFNDSAVKEMDSKFVPKSKMTIQKQLLGLKKNILSLKREGRLDEAEEEMKKCGVLEAQLKEMDGDSKLKPAKVNKKPGLIHKHVDISEDSFLGDDEVTDQDIHDPTYLSLLRELGWKDEDNKSTGPSVQPAPSRPSRSKAEIQKELLGLKRKALVLRRQGKTEEADEVLKTAKSLEFQTMEMENQKIELQVDSKRGRDSVVNNHDSLMEAGDEEDVTEKDMHDSALLSMLKGVGWDDEKHETVSGKDRFSELDSSESCIVTDQTVIQSTPKASILAPKSKGQIQKELLDLKRKSLAHRRKGETQEAEELLRKAKVLEAQMEEVDAPKKESSFRMPSAGKLENMNTFNCQEKHGSLKDTMEADDRTNMAAKFPSDGAVESSIGLEGTSHPILRDPDNLIPIHSEIVKDKQSLGGGTALTSRHGHSANLMDALMEDPANKVEDKSGSNISLQAGSSVQIDLLKKDQSASIDDARTEKREDADKGLQAPKTHSAQMFSQDSNNSLRQEILSHKKKAVTLKREGKLAEAKEELRMAKQVEKILEGVNSQPQNSAASVSSSSVPSLEQSEHGSSNLALKPLSSRERFKLQQESLSHKRQALKLRREGRMEEAEAEFELAKSLEAQLEESSSIDSMKSSNNEAESVDDVNVEDFLDPQLRSALRAIGLEDSKPELTKPDNVSCSRTSSQERHELGEQIKAEKIKALNLKRSGKQTEALNALRRAKGLEKRLNSLLQ